MTESWLPIPEEPFSDLYQISSLGRIKSVRTGKILRQKTTNGYFTINLRNPLNGDTHTIAIHRVMLMTFDPRENYKELVVNHKDHNKTNNNLENLEWCTQKENIQHSIKSGKIKTNDKSIIGAKDSIDYIFSSIKEAANTVGCHDRAIGLVLAGKNPTAKGYVWRYVNQNPLKVESNTEEMSVVDDYPNYMVTRSGQVYNCKNKRFLKPIPNKNGYVYVTLCKAGKKKNRYVHTLIAACYIENPENKPFVNHIDSNKQNNAVDNLEWCTQSENTIHYYNNRNTAVRNDESKDHHGSGENSEVTEESAE